MFWMAKHGNFSLIFHYQTVSEPKNIFPKVYIFFWNFKPQTVLTHNMTRDCPLNFLKNTCDVQIFFWMSKQKQKQQFLYTTCCELVFFAEFIEQSPVVLWVNWCMNEGFWKRFTYTYCGITKAVKYLMAGSYVLLFNGPLWERIQQLQLY